MDSKGRSHFSDFTLFCFILCRFLAGRMRGFVIRMAPVAVRRELLYDRHWGSPSLLRRAHGRLTLLFVPKTANSVFVLRQAMPSYYCSPIRPNDCSERRKTVLSISLPYSGVHPSRCFGKRHDVQHVSWCHGPTTRKGVNEPHPFPVRFCPNKLESPRISRQNPPTIISLWRMHDGQSPLANLSTLGCALPADAAADAGDHRGGSYLLVCKIAN